MAMAIFVASLGWIAGCSAAVCILRRSDAAAQTDIEVQSALANAEALLTVRRPMLPAARIDGRESEGDGLARHALQVRLIRRAG